MKNLRNHLALHLLRTAKFLTKTAMTIRHVPEPTNADVIAAISEAIERSRTEDLSVMRQASRTALSIITALRSGDESLHEAAHEIIVDIETPEVAFGVISVMAHRLAPEMSDEEIDAIGNALLEAEARA